MRRRFCVLFFFVWSHSGHIAQKANYSKGIQSLAYPSISIAMTFNIVFDASINESLTELATDVLQNAKKKHITNE